MGSLGASRFFLLSGLLALFAFSGDLVAYTLEDACGNHCNSQSSQSDFGHEKAPCTHCSCAVHNGSVLSSSSLVSFTGGFEPSGFVLSPDQFAPAGLPADIDHPPQLG